MTGHVVICMPAGDRICTDTHTDLVSLGHYSRHLIHNEVDVKATYISHGHNDLVRWNLFKPGVTKLLFIDSDMRLPVDTLERLDRHDLDIVGCTYKKRGGTEVLGPDGKVVGYKHQMMINRIPGREYPRQPQPLEEWAKLASGVLLVKTKVFRKIGWPWFFETYGPTPDDFIGTDYNFCFKAREHGFKVWCDLELSREVRHLCGDEPLFFEWPEDGPPEAIKSWGEP